MYWTCIGVFSVLLKKISFDKYYIKFQEAHRGDLSAILSVFVYIS